MRKKICILLIATFLEDRHMNKQLQVFLWGKWGGVYRGKFFHTYAYKLWTGRFENNSSQHMNFLHAQSMEKDLHSIISTFRKNIQTKCLADMTSSGMLCASLQHVSLGTQLACFVNSYIVLAHACCVSTDNTILVLKLCVLVPDYCQAFLPMCTVGAVALLA